jgi:hypothetical protein
MTTTFSGPNPPPSTTREITTDKVPTGIGNSVGQSTEVLTDEDGIPRKNVWNISASESKPREAPCSGTCPL